jgi:hypothetical protein
MMKTILILALLLAAAASTVAQGWVRFQNSMSTGITNTVTGLPAAGSAAQNDTQVGLYIGNVGDSFSSLQLIGPTTNCFFPGRFAGGTRTLPGWTGTVLLQVRAWLASTVYPSYEAAYAGAMGGDTSVLLGVSGAFVMALTEIPAPPPEISTNGLTPIFLSPIPEPSQLALGALGLGVLLLFRRRKGDRRDGGMSR